MTGPLDLDRALTLQQLRTFRAVADHLSFSAAAVELGISQPSVSYQVKELETVLGLALLDRLGKRVRLTEAGEILYGYARRTLSLLDEAVVTFEQMRGLRRGRLRVGATTTVGIYVIPLALGAFKKSHPGLQVSLDISGRNTMQDRVLKGKVDVAILSPPVDDADLVAEPFMDDELVMVVPAGHPLGSREGLTLRDFKGEPFLMREAGSGTRLAVEQAAQKAGVTLQTAMELGSNGAIKHAVEAGLGVAVLSRHAIELERRDGGLVVVDVAGFPILRAWSIVHVRRQRLPAAVEEFMHFLLSDQWASAVGRQPAAVAVP
jgi:LysR family transcriptional regulator, low CO2-responsive transcriptional regulator